MKDYRTPFWATLAIWFALSGVSHATSATFDLNTDRNPYDKGAVSLNAGERFGIDFNNGSSGETAYYQDSLTISGGLGNVCQVNLMNVTDHSVFSITGDIVLDMLATDAPLLKIDAPLGGSSAFRIDGAGTIGGSGVANATIQVVNVDLIFNGTGNNSGVILGTETGGFHIVDRNFVVKNALNVPRSAIHFHGGELHLGEDFGGANYKIFVEAMPEEVAQEEGIEANCTGMLMKALSGSSTPTLYSTIQYNKDYQGRDLDFVDSDGNHWGKAILLLGKDRLAITDVTLDKTQSIAVGGEYENDTFKGSTLVVSNVDYLKNDDPDPNVNKINLGFAGGTMDFSGINTVNLSGHKIKTIDIHDLGLYPAGGTIIAGDHTPSSLTITQSDVDLSKGILTVEKSGANLTVTVDCENQYAGIDTTKLGGLSLGNGVTLNLTNTVGTEIGLGNVEGAGTIVQADKTIDLGSDVAQNDADTGFAGTLVAGELNKVGSASTVIESGATVTIANNAQIEEGLLVVNSDNFTLNGGNGTMSVSGGELGGAVMNANIVVGDGGTLGPGMSIGYHKTIGNLSLNSGAVLEIEVEPLAAGINLGTPGKNHDNDLEHVTGNVNFQSGSQIEITKDSDSTSTNQAKVGDKYKVLIVEGAVTGESNVSVAVDSSLGSFSASYEWANETNTYYDSTGAERMLPGNWLIVELRPGYQPVSPNERAVNQYIQSATGTAAQNIRTQLNGMTQTQQRQALNELSGQPIGTATSCVIQNSSSAMNTLADNIRPTAGMGTMGMMTRRQYNTMTVLAQNGCCSSGWTSWTRGYGMGGSIFADENSAGTTVAVGGLVVGLERQYDMNTKLGLFYTYGGANSRVDSLSSAVQTNHHLWGAYAVRNWCSNYFVLGGGIGADFYDSRRVNRIGTIQELALDKYDGWQALVYGEYGTSLQTRWATLQPYFGLQYIYLRTGAHTEDQTLAPNTANSYSAMNYDSLRTKLGLRVKKPLHVWNFSGNLELRSTWVHELLKRTAPIYGAGLAGSTGGYIAQGTDIGRDWCVLGAGLRWNLNHRTECYLDYDLNFNVRQTMHTGSGGLAFKF